MSVSHPALTHEKTASNKHKIYVFSIYIYQFLETH